MIEGFFGVVVGAVITGLVNYFLNEQKFKHQQCQYKENRDEEAQIRNYEKFTEIAASCVGLKIALDEKQNSAQELSPHEKELWWSVIEQFNKTLPVVLLYASDPVHEKLLILYQSFFEHELNNDTLENKNEGAKVFNEKLRSICELTDEIHLLMRNEIRNMREIKHLETVKNKN